MIGKEVRRRREELGLTGAQLAARAGMAPSAVSQIETGKRSPSSTSVVKLAGALGLGVEELFPKAAQPSFTEGEMEAALRRADDSIYLLRSYFEDPPDEEAADEAMEMLYESVPRVLGTLADMERSEMAKYAGRVAALIREYAEVSQRLATWNKEQYGHLHEETA